MTEEATGLGLHLNHSESEISSSDPSAIADIIEVVPDLCPVSPDKAHISGSPVGGVDDTLSEKITGALETMGNRLCHFVLKMPLLPPATLL